MASAARGSCITRLTGLVSALCRSASSERPWWHLSQVSTSRGELPPSDAPGQLLQPGAAQAEDTALLDSKTVEAPPRQPSSPSPAKKKGETEETLCLCPPPDLAQ